MTNPHSQALLEFDRIVELSEAERNAAMSTLDPVIAALVIEMLRADAASSGVLDQGVQVLATELVGVEDLPALSALQTGDLIGVCARSTCQHQVLILTWCGRVAGHLHAQRFVGLRSRLLKSSLKDVVS
jgi:hypothetical protein